MKDKGEWIGKFTDDELFLLKTTIIDCLPDSIVITDELKYNRLWLNKIIEKYFNIQELNNNHYKAFAYDFINNEEDLPMGLNGFAILLGYCKESIINYELIV